MMKGVSDPYHRRFEVSCQPDLHQIRYNRARKEAFYFTVITITPAAGASACEVSPFTLYSVNFQNRGYTVSLLSPW